MLLDSVLCGSLYTMASQVYRKRIGEVFFQITRKLLSKPINHWRIYICMGDLSVGSCISLAIPKYQREVRNGC